MSDDQQATHFSFEQFADAPSAQAAFEAAFSLGSPAEPALQALVDMGAQCKRVGSATAACRYLEERALAFHCWHVALERNVDNRIHRVSIALALLAP